MGFKTFQSPSYFEKNRLKHCIFFTREEVEAPAVPYVVEDNEGLIWGWGALTESKEALETIIRNNPQKFGSLENYKDGKPFPLRYVKPKCNFNSRHRHKYRYTTYVYKGLCPECLKMSYFGDFLVPLEEKSKEISILKEFYGEDKWKIYSACYASMIPLFNHSEQTRLVDIGFVFDNEKAFCPHCGHDLSDLFFKDFSYRALTVPQDNQYLVNTTVFDDVDEKGKIVFSNFMQGYGVSKDKTRMYTKGWRTRIMFNVKTGMSYFIPDKKAPKGVYSSHMINITYGSCEVTNLDLGINKDAVWYLFTVLAKAKKLPKYVIQSWQNGFSDESLISPSYFLCLLSILNRIPCLTFEQAQAIASLSNTLDFRTNKYRIVGGTKQADNFNAVLEQFIKNCRLKSTKKIRRMLVQDLSYLFPFYMFSRYGFTDPNLIDRFNTFVDKCKKLNRPFKYDGSSHIPAFSKKLISIRGEIGAINALVNGSKWVEDTARTYYLIMQKDPSVMQNDFLRGTMEEMHNKLSTIYLQIKHKNTPIPYKTGTEYLDASFGEYEFKRAVDTHELIKVGQIMHICVGSYGDNAVAGNLIIVVGRNNKGVPVMCIELIPKKSGFILKQAKTFANNHIQSDMAYALKQWVEAIKIDTTECPDYEHIRNNQIDSDPAYKQTYDWHQLEIDENGNVFEA